LCPQNASFLHFAEDIGGGVHCAKSHGPFELFANENCKLQNEDEMNVMFERGPAEILGAILSLLSLTMLLREESACEPQTLL